MNDMGSFWSMIAELASAFATVGAGFRSTGIFFEPDVPEELQ